VIPSFASAHLVRGFQTSGNLDEQRHGPRPLYGVRVEPTGLTVWVGSSEVTPTGGTLESVLLGVNRAELNGKELPAGKGLPLLVEADVSERTCSNIAAFE